VTKYNNIRTLTRNINCTGRKEEHEGQKQKIKVNSKIALYCFFFFPPEGEGCLQETIKF
jgi:hypothetical protein